MKQVRIILKSGKEVTFKADDRFPISGCFSTTDSDGTEYRIAESEIAAEIITPMVKCPLCGKWTVPEEEIIHGGCGTANDIFQICHTAAMFLSMRTYPER